MRFRCLISLLFLLIFTLSAYARFVAEHPSSSSLISDGVDGDQNVGSGSIIKMVVLAEEEEACCKQTYGFMPCTKTALGNMFQILVYGFLMYIAATYLSYGSELLLGILGPGIIGGLFLPMLGLLPDAMIILVSGLSGDASTAQSQIAVGMGSLAGSTVMLLTVIWGTCTVVGKCDLQNSVAVTNQDTKGFHLKDSGVTVEPDDEEGLLMMKVSQMNVSFENTYKDGHLSAAELKALLIGINFEGIYFNQDDAVGSILQDFDMTQDDQVDEDEFVRGIKHWLLKAMRASRLIGPDASPQSMKFLDHFHAQTMREHTLCGDNENSENEDEGGEVLDPIWVTTKAALMLLLGASIAAVFADPLVDTVNNFSTASGIPSFFISFIVLPLATSSEAVSAIVFASRKKIGTASLTFSQLCGGVTMTNILCLSVFLAIVYLRGLTWNFSSEVLVILIVCVVMGGFASFRTTYPLWTCFLAYSLYPFSLGLVYILDYKFGWS